MADLIITSLSGTSELLTDFSGLTRKRQVNGEHSLSFLLLKSERNAHSFDMVEEETIVEYDGDRYRVKQIEERLVGHTPVKQVHAEHVFFDIIDVYQYGKLSTGNNTITLALQHALAGTGYTFSVIDSFASQYFEDFGDDNALSLLKTILERYQAEYRLVGNDVRIYKQIGSETDFQFRYKHNIKTFAKTVKTDGLSTYIKGYGKENKDGTYTATAEYTSPMADIYGIRHAKPIRDDRFTDSAALLDYIKSQINDTPEMSITIDFADMRKAGYPYDVPGFGDTVYLIYEPLNVDMSTRILEIIDYPESDKSPQVTLANFREQFADVMFRHTKNELEKIYDPNTGKLRNSVLDDAVRDATEALQSAQTELEFNNGIIAREKTNPNKIVVFNSAGLGISTNNGAEFNAAITADGVVAERIVGGYIIGVNLASANETGMFHVNGSNAEFLDTVTGRLVKMSPDGLYGYNAGGDVRFQADKLLVTSAALGTSNSNVYLAPDSTNEVRVVDVRSIPSDGVAENYSYRPIRAQGLRFGPNANGYIGTEGEVRITSSGFTQEDGSVIYRPLRAAAVYSNNFVTTSTSLWMGTDSAMHVVNKGFVEDSTGSPIYRDIFAGRIWGSGFISQTDNAYIGANGELRVVNKGFVDGSSGTPIYRDVRASVYRGVALDLDGTTNAEHMYVRPSATGSLRVTSRGTTDSYRPIEASEFNAASSVFYKKNIEDYTGDATDLIDGTPVRLYHLNEDIDTIDFKRVGLLVQEAPREIINMKTGDSIDLYAMASVLWKAVQELSAEIRTLKGGTTV